MTDTLIELLAKLADDKAVDPAYAKDDFFSGAEIIARRQLAQRAYEIVKQREIGFNPTPDNPCGHSLRIHDTCPRCGMLGAAEYMDKAQQGEIRVTTKRCDEVLHLLRNPYGHSEEEMRKARLYAANAIEELSKVGSEPKREAIDWESRVNFYEEECERLKDELKERESGWVAVDDTDVEIAIAEAIAIMEPRMDYCEKGIPVLKYLKKSGWSVMQPKSDIIEDGSANA